MAHGNVQTQFSEDESEGTESVEHTRLEEGRSYRERSVTRTLVSLTREGARLNPYAPIRYAKWNQSLLPQSFWLRLGLVIIMCGAVAGTYLLIHTLARPLMISGTAHDNHRHFLRTSLSLHHHPTVSSAPGHPVVLSLAGTTSSKNPAESSAPVEKPKLPLSTLQTTTTATNRSSEVQKPQRLQKTHRTLRASPSPKVKHPVSFASKNITGPSAQELRQRQLQRRLQHHKKPPKRTPTGRKPLPKSRSSPRGKLSPSKPTPKEEKPDDPNAPYLRVYSKLDTIIPQRGVTSATSARQVPNSSPFPSFASFDPPEEFTYVDLNKAPRPPSSRFPEATSSVVTANHYFKVGKTLPPPGQGSGEPPIPVRYALWSYQGPEHHQAKTYDALFGNSYRLERSPKILCESSPTSVPRLRPPHDLEVSIFGPEPQPNVSVLRMMRNTLLDMIFLEAYGLTIDVRKILVTHGGEQVLNVLGRNDRTEIPKYLPGALSMHCSLTKPDGEAFFGRTGKTSGEFKRDGYHHITDMMQSMTFNSSLSNRQFDPSECDIVQDTPTIIVVRYEYANLYHTLGDWFMLYQSAMLTRLSGKRFDVLVIDGHARGALDDVWRLLMSRLITPEAAEKHGYPSIRAIKHIFAPDPVFPDDEVTPRQYLDKLDFSGAPSQRLCLRHAVFAPAAYNGPITINRRTWVESVGSKYPNRRTPHFHDFVSFFLAAHGVRPFPFPVDVSTLTVNWRPGLTQIAHEEQALVSARKSVAVPPGPTSSDWFAGVPPSHYSPEEAEAMLIKSNNSAPPPELVAKKEENNNKKGKIVTTDIYYRRAVAHKLDPKLPYCFNPQNRAGMYTNMYWKLAEMADYTISMYPTMAGPDYLTAQPLVMRGSPPHRSNSCVTLASHIESRMAKGLTVPGVVQLPYWSPEIAKLYKTLNPRPPALSELSTLPDVCDPIRVTLVLRRQYLGHPRAKPDKLSRAITNGEEVSLFENVFEQKWVLFLERINN